jgi:transcriptional regulator
MKDEFITELKNLNKLLVLLLTKGQTQTESIILLNKAGFQQKIIAEYLGTTSNTVNVALNRAKKGK